MLFLKENHINTISLESTGSYWQSLFMIQCRLVNVWLVRLEPMQFALLRVLRSIIISYLNDNDSTKNGFEVLLVQGSQTKNLKAKTDVKDAQWIQKLDTLGLLKASFPPS